MIRRKRRCFEQLERRCVLAVGLIPIDLLIPLSSNENSGEFTVDGSVAVKLNAMVLDPKADEVSDVSLTGYEFNGSGTFAGPIEGVDFSGSFVTDPIESPNSPDIPIQVNPSTQSIDFVLTQTGTFEASSGLLPVTGTFTIVAELTVDFNTREAIGQTTTTFIALDRVETQVSPVRLANVIPLSVEFPDATKSFVSGRTFVDRNNSGRRGGANETGVAEILASLMNGSTQLESVTTDANGFYSFYNLDAESRSIRFRELPSELDFGKMRVGNDASIDSDADSRTGITSPLEFNTQLGHENIDVGFRLTDFEWENPNLSTDVNNDRSTTASDALAIINLLSRLEAGVNSLELPENREPGEDFVDVDRNGVVNAADALAVIFALYEESLLGSVEQEIVHELDELERDLLVERFLRKQDSDQVTSLF